MNHTPLGKPTTYPERYDPALLAPMPRSDSRAAIGLAGALPFTGEDVWNGYEFSWLDAGGRPRVAGLRLRVDAASPAIVESKSMKLYLNGFAQARFDDEAAVMSALNHDLSEAFGARVDVALLALAELAAPDADLPGKSLDYLDLTADIYERTPNLLVVEEGAAVAETLHTELFRSLCPVTGQPDWASILIDYQGPAMNHGALLRYLISYRRHQAFHETTVEQIFMDLKERCRCDELMVAGYFLRRGGLDINPLRADHSAQWPVRRTARQ